MNVWKTRHYTSDRGGEPTANSKSFVQRQQRTDDQVTAATCSAPLTIRPTAHSRVILVSGPCVSSMKQKVLQFSLERGNMWSGPPLLESVLGEMALLGISPYYGLLLLLGHHLSFIPKTNIYAACKKRNVNDGAEAQRKWLGALCWIISLVNTDRSLCVVAGPGAIRGRDTRHGTWAARSADRCAQQRQSVLVVPATAREAFHAVIPRPRLQPDRGQSAAIAGRRRPRGHRQDDDCHGLLGRHQVRLFAISVVDCRLLRPVFRLYVATQARLQVRSSSSVAFVVRHTEYHVTELEP